MLVVGQRASMPTPGEQITIAVQPFLGMVGGMPTDGIGKVQAEALTSEFKRASMLSRFVHGSALFAYHP